MEFNLFNLVSLTLISMIISGSIKVFAMGVTFQ